MICRKPCRTCPWRKDVTPGALGGTPPEVHLGQMWGPFWLPCHSTPGYTPRLDKSLPECVGVAMMRSATGRADILPSSLLSADSDGSVFDSPRDFLIHHRGSDVGVPDDPNLEPLITKFTHNELEMVRLGMTHHS